MTKLSLLMFALTVGFTASASEEKIFNGMYWVPVTQELAKFSVFDLKDVKVIRDGASLEIKYTIPTELTGAKNDMAFKGNVAADGSAVLSSDSGHMNCQDADDLATCEFNYGSLKINATAREELLKSIAKTPTEFDLRMQVARSFEMGGQPQGFMRLLAK